MRWVVQTAFVGDCVLSLPFLARLVEIEKSETHRDGAKPGVVWVTQKGIQAEMMKLAIDRYFTDSKVPVHLKIIDKRGTDASLIQTVKKVRLWRKEFGAAKETYCLQRSFRSACMALASGAGERIGFGSGAASFLYTQTVARSWIDGVSEIEKNLDLLRANYKIEAWPVDGAPSLLASTNRPTRQRDRVAMALGSPWPTKRWPVEEAAELSLKLTREGVEVVLIGDPAAKELADEIVKANKSLLLKNLVGQTNASQWADEIDACSLLISGDSASVHVASDLGVPVLALFGPTIPDFGFAPWRLGSRVLQVADLACRPCHIHGPKQCPLGHHKCLKDISAQQVFQESKDLLVDPLGKRG